jgi:cytochrome c-type biogenesis protein CcmH/NrfG
MHHLVAYLAIAFLGFISTMLEPAFAVGSSDDSGGASAAPQFSSAQQAVNSANYQAAITLLQQVVTVEPTNADAWNLLGFSNRKLGNMDAAASAYTEALTINPGHLGALEYQGEMFVQLGQIDNAKVNLARLQSLCGACEEMVDLQEAIDKAKG